MQDPIDTNLLASYIDHTLLRPDATHVSIERLCCEAMEYGFLGVCVNGSWVKHARLLLGGTSVRVVSVVGFPLGAMSRKAKCFEAECAIADGADEIDFVLNIGRLIDGDLDYVTQEIRAIAAAAAPKQLKAIIETSLLNRDQKIRACELAVDGGAGYIKTSTGFGVAGATAEDVKLLRDVVGPHIGVKASGGIRDRKTAIEMLRAGASRIGSSAGIAIIKGERESA